MVTVIVCRKCKQHESIVRYLEKQTDACVRTARCQKVCDSPVAGLRVDGRWEWFGDLDGPKQLKALASLVEGEVSIPKALKKCRDRGRSGSPPR
jgi:hypothetical protein